MGGKVDHMFKNNPTDSRLGLKHEVLALGLHWVGCAYTGQDDGLCQSVGY